MLNKTKKNIKYETNVDDHFKDIFYFILFYLKK